MKTCGERKRAFSKIIAISLDDLQVYSKSILSRYYTSYKYSCLLASNYLDFILFQFVNIVFYILRVYILLILFL